MMRNGFFQPKHKVTLLLHSFHVMIIFPGLLAKLYESPNLVAYIWQVLCKYNEAFRHQPIRVSLWAGVTENINARTGILAFKKMCIAPALLQHECAIQYKTDMRQDSGRRHRETAIIQNVNKILNFSRGRMVMCCIAEE
jgi:hypothetical protein